VATLLAYIRSLNPRLPRGVKILQLGGLANSFGNGLAYPFTFIYLHNVRGFELDTAGLIIGASSAVGLFAGPAIGALADKIGARTTLAMSLGFLSAGFLGYPLIREPWHGFALSVLVGIGNGGFWPSQSSLLAGLTPRHQRHQAFAMQRVMMNLGIGLGGLAGGLIATTSRPSTFTVLFVADSVTFLVFASVLAAVPRPTATREPHERIGSYLDVVRNRVFVAVIALNFVFITAGMAQLESLPVYAKNEAGVSERGIGLLFFVNTLVVVLAQLPVTRLLEGHRRMRTLGVLGLVWAGALLLVPIAGVVLAGLAATAMLAFVFALIAVGECLHGTVQAPLVADLADHRLIGRYMAASAFSWSVGFTAGPSLGGVVLKHAPHLLWPGAAAVCLLAGLAALGLEPSIPRSVRRTPARAEPAPAVPG
jgi:MFS family permease